MNLHEGVGQLGVPGQQSHCDPQPLHNKHLGTIQERWRIEIVNVTFSPDCNLAEEGFVWWSADFSKCTEQSIALENSYLAVGTSVGLTKSTQESENCSSCPDSAPDRSVTLKGHASLGGSFPMCKIRELG